MSKNTITRPAYIACAGVVRASVWESVRAGGLQHKILVSYLYRRPDRSWHRGYTFRPTQLEALTEAVQDARNWIASRNLAMRQR